MLNVAIGNFSQYLLLQYCVSGQAHKAYLLEENFKKKKKKKNVTKTNNLQKSVNKNVSKRFVIKGLI